MNDTLAPAASKSRAEPYELDRATAARLRKRAIYCFLASCFVVGFGLGVSIPLASVWLVAEGVSDTMIGLSAATPMLAVLIVGPFVSRLIPVFGPIRLFLVCTLAMAAVFPLMAAFPGLWPWFPLRFAMGCAMAVNWILGETLMNALTTRQERGFYLGLYATLLAGGFAVGPAFLTLLDPLTWTPFLLVSGVIALAALPLWVARKAVSVIPEMGHGSSWGTLILMAPLVFFGTFVSGMLDNVTLSLTTVWGERHGLDQDTAILLVTVLVAGQVTMSMPFGWLADRMPRERLVTALAVLGVASALVLPVALGTTWLLWSVVFLLGSSIYGIYTVALAMLGDRFEGQAIAQANAGFVMIFCIGGMAGPPLAGGAMGLAGPDGFAWFIAVAAAVLVAVCLASFLRRGAEPAG